MINIKFNYLKILYNFFLFLSLIIFFFSTDKVEGKPFDINNIEISRPFEINFDKNEVIDEGFKKAFSELILLTINSYDQKKINKVKLNEIKGMIEKFSIKEEKFINETYFVNLGVSFNKKKFFNYLEKVNIFPSIPKKKKFLFIPVIIDENKKELLIFSKNQFYDHWNDYVEKFHLIEYILPTEDLEDYNLVKNNYDSIEEYNFKEITEKYNLENYIVALIFKNKDEIRILSRITVKNDVVLKNQSFSDINFNKKKRVDEVINELKLVYEDYWKNFNQINTSIKLTLNIKVNNSDNHKIKNFESALNKVDLVYEYNILKFDKDYVFYQITYNGTPNNFLKSMFNKNFNIDTQNEIWILK